MKDIVNSLYYSATENLIDMKKERMLLSDRIKYEKALVQLSIMKKIIDKCNLGL